MVKVPCLTRGGGAPEGIEEEIEEVLVDRFVRDDAVLAMEDAEL